MLRSLGFSLDLVEHKARLYRSETTGALVALPPLPDHQRVLSRHLLAVRSILEAYDIVDPLDFAEKLQRAS